MMKASPNEEYTWTVEVTARLKHLLLFPFNELEGKNSPLKPEELA